jgi:hypothetical protein
VLPLLRAAPDPPLQRALWRAGREVFAGEVRREMVRFRAGLWCVRKWSILGFFLVWSSYLFRLGVRFCLGLSLPPSPLASLCFCSGMSFGGGCVALLD